MQECRTVFSELEFETLPLFEQLQLLFNDEVCERDSVAMFRYFQREYSLHVTLVGNEFRQVERVVNDAFLLSNELFKLLPNRWSDDIDVKNLDKHKFGFSHRGEVAVFQIWRNINASIIEMQVKTETLEGEFLYWSKDKIFVINFVSEFDEEHAIAGIYTV